MDVSSFNFKSLENVTLPQTSQILSLLSPSSLSLFSAIFPSRFLVKTHKKIFKPLSLLYFCKQLKLSSNLLQTTIAKCNHAGRPSCGELIMAIEIFRTENFGCERIPERYVVLVLSRYLGVESTFSVERTSSQSWTQSIRASSGRISVRFPCPRLPVVFTACVNLAFTVAVNSPRSSEYVGNPSRL